MRQVRPIAFVIPVIGILMVGVASAAPIPWATPSGSNANFSYAEGKTLNGLFVEPGQSPIVTPTGLIFFPSGFIASAAGGTAEVVDDTLQFEIHLPADKQLTQFIVNEFGDYTIDGSGPNTSVKAFGGLLLVNMDDPFAPVLTDTLSTVPAPLATGTGVTTGEGIWTGNETIVAIPAGWKNIQVILNNELSASSDVGTTAFIQKKVGQVGVEIILVIPEPGTLSLGLLGGLACLVRRSRRVIA